MADLSEDSCKLTQLSDCLMITILSYLDATSLYQLGRTCDYFNNIVKDKKLWHIIDARADPNTNEKINYVLERVHEKTRHLLLKGQGRKTRIHKGFFYNLWDNITVLALEAQKIDGNFVSMCNLPSSLIELSLTKSIVKDSLSFFKYSDSHMANLRVLILNECSWLESNFLMSTAKYPNLEVLSIVNCHQLQINLTPYFSVARYGFNKIKLIDCRFTTMSHDFLRGFMLKTSLVCLYFQSMRSYKLDMNVPLFPKILEKTRKLTPYKIEEIQRLSIGNSSLYEFRYHQSSGLSEEIPKSILYEYPYVNCTCRSDNNSEEVLDPDETENDKPEENEHNIDDFIRYDRDSQRFICKKHLIHVQSLPNQCIQSFFGKNKRLLHNSDSSDSSSNESDSDIESSQCCIYGRTNGTKMIVMKINGNGSIDDEVIDIPPPPQLAPIIPSSIPVELQPRDTMANDQNSASITNANTSTNSRKSINNDSTFDDTAGPSTSRGNVGSVVKSRDTRKRKIEGDDPGTSSKRFKSVDGSASSSKSSEPSGSAENQVTENPSEPRNPPENPEIQLINAHLPISNQPRPNLAEPANFFNAQVVLRPLRDAQICRGRAQIGAVMGPGGPPRRLNLRHLSVRGYRKVDNKALEYIRHLNLDLLDVTYTNVTKEGVEKFLVYNPTCRVVHKDFCVCKPRIPS